MRLIVAGSRNYRPSTHIFDFLNKLDGITEIVSGGAKGPDSWGEQWAEENNIPVKTFYPDWSRYGKAAGPIRNKEMADYADACVVFWDGTSKGSSDMAKIARSRHLTTWIISPQIEMVS